MKNNFVGKSLFFLFLIGFSNSVFAFKSSRIIVVSNPTSFRRVNEVVSIERNKLGKIKPNLFPVVTKEKMIVTTQTIDKNSDGIWDELLIQVSLAANEKQTLQIAWVTKSTQFDKFTNVHLSLRSEFNTPSPEINRAERNRGFIQDVSKPYYQMEGIGIENDKVAFRAFFDYRNGKDIYGKIVQNPILEKVGVGATWHELQAWGMDVFRVGKSLGAGALAVQEDMQIYRLGDANKTNFQTLYEGSLQAAFSLNFKNWDVAKDKKDGSETISITKGNYYYRNDISLVLNANQNLVSGIGNFIPTNETFKKHNSKWSSISTYGNQAEGTMTKLGVAIMFSTEAFIENKKSEDSSTIPNTSYVVLKPNSKENTIYFFACWEKTDSQFVTQQGFEDYLQQTADILANPIEVLSIKKH